MPEAVTLNLIDCTLANLPRVASDLIKFAEGERIWLFYGNLGAGKTTLIKQICKQLGVQGSLPGSPTFSIINEYPATSGKVFHFDFYRMKNEIEILDLGVDEYFDSGNYCLIEWPERLGSLIPENYFKILITDSGFDSRTIEYEKHG